MSVEPQLSPNPVSDNAAREPSAWQRFLIRLEAIDDALNTSYDEIQDRRILALEKEVESLKQRLDAIAVDGLSLTKRP
jgi:hypothetical protein